MKKTYSSQFKSKEALEALQGDKNIAEIAGKYQVHANQVQQWKKKLLDNAEGILPQWRNARKIVPRCIQKTT